MASFDTTRRSTIVGRSLVRAAAAALLLAATVVPARADPILSPIIIAIGASLGVTVTATAASIIGAIVITAIGIGLSLLFAPTAPKPPTPENGSIAVQQSTPFRAFAYGTTRYSGCVVLKEEKAGYLAYVAALFGHSISAYKALYLNDDLATVSIVGGLISGTVEAGSDGRYGSFSVKMDSRRGAVPETPYTAIVTAIPTAWKTTCRGDGVSSISMLCSPVEASEFQKVYPYQAPSPSVVLDTCATYDPRDPAQSPNNPSSWHFNRNVALAILHHQCFNVFGPSRDYATAVYPVLDQWIEAINDCDDIVALKSGATERRYVLGGWITTEQDRKTVLQTLLQSCDGWFVERGDGTIVLKVGKYRAPTVVLTDDDIVGWTVQRDVASTEKVNQATAKYTSPANGYVTVETSPVMDLDDQARRIGPPKSAQLDLGWVQSTGQASRLLRREMQKQKEKTRGKLTLRLAGINACYERWVMVASNSVPRLNGVVVENMRPQISLQTGTCTIDFVSSGPQVDDYVPARDESPPPLIPQKPDAVGVPVPQNVAAVPVQAGYSTSAASIVLNVSWDQPLNDDGTPLLLSYRVEWRIADTGAGSPGRWVPQAFPNVSSDSGRDTVTTATVQLGGILDVRVSSVSTLGTISAPSDIVQVDTTVTPPPPPPPPPATP